jgi:hypothetical protein
VGAAHLGLVPGLAAPRGGDKKPTSDAGKVVMPHWQKRWAGQHESWPAIGACARGRYSISVEELRSETCVIRRVDVGGKRHDVLSRRRDKRSAHNLARRVGVG